MEEIVNLDKLPKGNRCKIVTSKQYGNYSDIELKKTKEIYIQEFDKFLVDLIKRNGTTKL